MTERSQVNFVERGIRGGFSFSCTRYLADMGGQSILYIDQNNLYGNYFHYLPEKNLIMKIYFPHRSCSIRSFTNRQF